MEPKQISDEEELVLWESFVKSDYWKTYQAWLSHQAFTLVGAAVSQNVEKREWMAGKASGVKEALQYPAKRVRDLRTKLHKGE